MIEVKNTKLLFLYRSFLFKFTKFKTNNKELKREVTALNIKNRKQRISYVYDEAIKEINNYYKDDLCQFENGQCIVQRQTGKGNVNGCCRWCPLVTDKGCPSSNLSCKLIYCKTAIKNIKLLRIRDIQILKCLSPLQRLMLKGEFFAVKEDIIKDLYYGPLRYIYTVLKRNIK